MEAEEAARVAVTGVVAVELAAREADSVAAVAGVPVVTDSLRRVLFPPHDYDYGTGGLMRNDEPNDTVRAMRRTVQEQQRRDHLIPYQTNDAPLPMRQISQRQIVEDPEITPNNEMQPPTTPIRIRLTEVDDTKDNLRHLMALVDTAGESMKKGEVLSEGTWLEMCDVLKILYEQVDTTRV